MRYITKQQHEMSCGPVAVMNALKWLGCSVSYKEHLDDFDWDYNYGIRHSEINESLKFFGIRYKAKINPTVRDIEDILDKGRAVMLSWATCSKIKRKIGGRHTVFIDRHTPARIMSKNTWGRGAPFKDFITKKRLNWEFRIGKRHGYKPKIWEIIK